MKTAVADLAAAEVQLNVGNNAYQTSNFNQAQTDYQNALNDANAAQSSLATTGGATDAATMTSIWLGAVAVLLGGIGAVMVGSASSTSYATSPGPHQPTRNFNSQVVFSIRPGSAPYLAEPRIFKPKLPLSFSVSHTIQFISGTGHIDNDHTLRQVREITGKDELQSSSSDRLHSAPKGLLRLYILHKIGQKPAHGYELMQDIDSKTEGGWRPGAGSLYPILKKLASEGFIKAESGISSEATRRIYQITPEGVKNLAEGKQMFSGFQHRWNNLRNLFIELVDPENVATFFVDGSKRQFQLAQEMLESKASKISQGELEFMLKEYVLNLERQLSWANETLNQLKPKMVHQTLRQKGARSL